MAPRVTRKVAKATANSGPNTGSKNRRPGTFQPGEDPRRGKGCAKGAPNAGRPPSAIREAYRQSAADRLAFIESVIDGEPMVKVRDAFGNETGHTVSASVADRVSAWDKLNKYGIGTTTSVVDKDGEDTAPGRLSPDAMRDAIAAILGVRP